MDGKWLEASGKVLEPLVGGSCGVMGQCGVGEVLGWAAEAGGVCRL